MTPGPKLAMFKPTALLLTKAMPPITKCPKCESSRLLRGELLVGEVSDGEAAP